MGISIIPHHKNVTEGNIFQFSGKFYKNNALVLAYGKYVVFKIERLKEHSISLDWLVRGNILEP